MKWVARERPKIDRIACPWLIARFIDKEPEFLYVPAAEVLSTAEACGAVPYDIRGVEMSHVGELCSFDAFVAKHKLTPAGPGAAAARRHRSRCGYLASRPDPAVRGPLRDIAGAVTDLLRRPRNAQARHGHLRRALCVVRELPGRDAQVTVTGRDLVVLCRVWPPLSTTEGV